MSGRFVGHLRFPKRPKLFHPLKMGARAIYLPGASLVYILGEEGASGFRVTHSSCLDDKPFSVHRRELRPMPDHDGIISELSEEQVALLRDPNMKLRPGSFYNRKSLATRANPLLAATPPGSKVYHLTPLGEDVLRRICERSAS